MNRQQLLASLAALIQQADYDPEQEPDVLMAIMALEYIRKGLHGAYRMDGLFTALLHEAKAQTTTTTSQVPADKAQAEAERRAALLAQAAQRRAPGQE